MDIITCFALSLVSSTLRQTGLTYVSPSTTDSRLDRQPPHSDLHRIGPLAPARLSHLPEQLFETRHRHRGHTCTALLEKACVRNLLVLDRSLQSNRLFSLEHA